MRKRFKTLVFCSALLCTSLIVNACNNNNVIQPDDKNITSILVKEGTIPSEIFVGEFDNAGIKLIVTYSDGTSEEVAVTTSLIPEKYRDYLNTPGTYKVGLLYKGEELLITINIVKPHHLVNFYAYTSKTEYELVSSQDVIVGTEVQVPMIDEELYIEGVHYTFKGWDKDFTVINTPLEIYAQYNSIEYFVVNFYNGNNEVISTQNVDKGSDAIEPSEEDRFLDGYEFVGWDRSYLNVTSSININGLYSKIYPEHDYQIGISNLDELTKVFISNQSVREIKLWAKVDGENVNAVQEFHDGRLKIKVSNDCVIINGFYVTYNKPGTVIVTITYFDATYSFELTTKVYDRREELGTDHYGTLEDPFTNEDTLIAARFFEANGGFTSEVFYFKGEVDGFYQAPGAMSNVCSWYMKPAIQGGERFEIYGAKKADGSIWGDTELWLGAIVTVHGSFAKYQSQYETATWTTIVDSIEGEKPADPIDINVTVAEAILAGRELEDVNSSWDFYIVTGYVVKNNKPNFFLADTKEAAADNKEMIELYNVTDATVLAGLLKYAKVSIKMHLKNYRGQIENHAKIVADDFQILEVGIAWDAPDE